MKDFNEYIEKIAENEKFNIKKITDFSTILTIKSFKTVEFIRKIGKLSNDKNLYNNVVVTLLVSILIGGVPVPDFDNCYKILEITKKDLMNIENGFNKDKDFTEK